jgi:hypothetical protein
MTFILITLIFLVVVLYMVFVEFGTDCLFHGINCPPPSNMTGV